MDITDSHDHDAFLRWTTLQQRPGGHFRIFDLEWVERVHPRKNVRGEFVVLHTPVWVNVLPLTADGKVVMVRQYRHGSDLVTLEFPGGVVAHGEEPAAAAMRECTEETGYASTPDKLVLVGEQLPNPAFMATRCYTYAWYDCVASQQPRWDTHEILEVVEVPLSRIEPMIAGGDIQHSIIIAAWTLFRLRALAVEPSIGGPNGQSCHDR